MKKILPLSISSFFGAAIGTMVEYYDYALFSTFITILSPIFFPASSLYDSLVRGYYILTLSMIARPIGALFFGYLGDVYGRRKALLISAYGIALATTLMGITPGYASIGLWAIIIIATAKTVQLACFAGEYNGAGIYVVEHARQHHEALVGSLLSATTLFGSLIASLMGIVITSDLVPSWSWRFAFILGGLFGVLGIIYRKRLLESPHFVQANLEQRSLVSLIKQYPRELLAGIFIGGFATVPFTTVLVFICPVLMSKGYFTNLQFMMLQTVLILLAVATLIGIGFIADRFTPKKVMRFACWALIILSIPLLFAVDSGKFLWLFLALAVFIIINEVFLGPSNAYLKNIFNMQYRYRGSSFGFCIGMSVLGGLTPLIENEIYHLTGQFSAISIWLILIGLGTYLSMRLVDKKQIASSHSKTLVENPVSI